MIHSTFAPSQQQQADRAIARDEQRLANQQADAFELTEAQFYNLAALPDPERAYQLQQLINAYDFDRRPLLGVYGSLTVLGMGRWQEAWLASLAEHMDRAWFAYEMAELRFVEQAA
ncbi:hypothetical protein [Allopontixanthobacter sediminis]|uniref:Uncharacterized protein n=1 Tax=Allopontixanthobacter sediminis TaxID=1689985 RepID=A0A845AXH1_9SPHN|nr:hypothetical protein [Allopontixanthobacter sediminis]MXP42955.1 hypothetical protein [Allopontixanthobacter sediminis]